MEVNPRGCPSFFKTYIGETRYRERIHIPPAFVKAHKNELDDRLWVVKTRNGKSWDMKIERQGSEYFFCKSSWEKFAENHNLSFGDIINFFLVRDSEFEVLLFSQTTSCEILSPVPEHTSGSLSDNVKDRNVGVSRKAKNGKRKRVVDPMLETSKNSKPKGDEGTVKVEEMSEMEEEEGIQIQRFSKFNLNAKYPYFVCTVKKSHRDFMFVPMRFAWHTGIIDEKEIVLRGENGKTTERVEITVSTKRVRMHYGWKNFRKATKIKNGDECSFTWLNPHRRRRETLCLSVKKLRSDGRCK